MRKKKLGHISLVIFNAQNYLYREHPMGEHTYLIKNREEFKYINIARFNNDDPKGQGMSSDLNRAFVKHSKYSISSWIISYELYRFSITFCKFWHGISLTFSSNSVSTSVHTIEVEFARTQLRVLLSDFENRWGNFYEIIRMNAPVHVYLRTPSRERGIHGAKCTIEIRRVFPRIFLIMFILLDRQRSTVSRSKFAQPETRVNDFSL